MGLLARGLEIEGIATTQTSWNAGRTRLSNPPRATLSKLRRGATMGKVDDIAQQRRVLDATLSLLAQDAPIEPVYLDESDED